MTPAIPFPRSPAASGPWVRRWTVCVQKEGLASSGFWTNTDAGIGDVRDALLLEHLLRGGLERVRVDDVARDEALGLVGEVLARLLAIVGLGDELEPLRDAARAR